MVKWSLRLSNAQRNGVEHRKRADVILSGYRSLVEVGVVHQARPKDPRGYAGCAVSVSEESWSSGVQPWLCPSA